MSFFNMSVDTEYYNLKDEEVLKSVLEIKEFSNAHGLKVTFFVEGNLLSNHPKFFKDLEDNGFEIASHGFDHIRFDKLSKEQITNQLQKSKQAAKKANLKHFIGFRAPQHSIRKKDLTLLKENGFTYDSSITSLNKWQFIFFPRRFLNNLQHFFSKPYPHKIGNIKEIPPSSFGIPLVSMSIRISPLWLVELIFLVCKRLSHGNVLFYIHNWDFLELKNSKIYKICPKNKFLNKLSKFIEFAKKHSDSRLLMEIQNSF